MSTASTLPGWYLELQVSVLRNLPRPGEIDQTTAEGWTGNQKALKKNLAGCLIPPDTAATVASPSQLGDAQAQLAAWQAFYTERGIELGEVTIPAQREGFDRLIVVAKGLNNNQVYGWCAEKFACWRYQEDLDSITSERQPTQVYAIWVRERVEADEEHKNGSAKQLKQDGVNGITLLERLLYELMYWQETGKHLDVKSITLCAGSRFSAGMVPYVGWGADDRRLCVDWCSTGRRDDDLRAREAVS